jgi:AraC family transcriptional regulator
MYTQKALEEHLEDEIDLERVARIARCSSFHFQRMFSYLADLPLSEYIRRRKMTRAVFDLQNSDEKKQHVPILSITSC